MEGAESGCVRDSRASPSSLGPMQCTSNFHLRDTTSFFLLLSSQPVGTLSRAGWQPVGVVGEGPRCAAAAPATATASAGERRLFLLNLLSP